MLNESEVLRILRRRQKEGGKSRKGCTLCWTHRDYSRNLGPSLGLPCAASPWALGLKVLKERLGESPLPLLPPTAHAVLGQRSTQRSGGCPDEYEDFASDVETLTST